VDTTLLHYNKPNILAGNVGPFIEPSTITQGRDGKNENFYIEMTMIRTSRPRWQKWELKTKMTTNPFALPLTWASH